MASAQPARSEYDGRAPDYAAYRGVHPDVVDHFVAQAGSATRVLEVGCGTGHYIAALMEATGCDATGVEPSAQMLARARMNTPGARLSLGRAEALPFADASFDVVFTVDMIHHVDDRAAHFREVARVLRPGGRIYTATDSEDDIPRRRPLSSHFRVDQVERSYPLTSTAAYRDRAYSALHLLPDDVLARRLAQMDAELARGPITALSLDTPVWACRPTGGQRSLMSPS